jgi:hypothetical protein
MVSRASHYSAKARHSQREFGAVKPKLMDQDEGTSWITTAVERLQVLPLGAYLNIDQISFVYYLSEFHLRELAKRGILHMRAHRDEDGKFIEYQWCLTPSGDLS